MNLYSLLKISLLFITFSFIAITLDAQPTEGKFMVGTSITYNYQLNDNYDAQGYSNGLELTNKNLTFSLQGGYLATDHFLIGLTMSYVDNNEVQQNLPAFQYTSVSKTWYYGLFARTYTTITGKLFFTNSFSVSIETGNNNAQNDSIKTGYQMSSSLKVSGYELNYSPGFSYFFNDWISINAAVGGVSYNHNTTTITSGTSTGTSTTNGLFSLNLPFSSFNFGVNFLIGKGSNKTTKNQN